VLCLVVWYVTSLGMVEFKVGGYCVTTLGGHRTTSNKEFGSGMLSRIFTADLRHHGIDNALGACFWRRLVFYAFLRLHLSIYLLSSQPALSPDILCPPAATTAVIQFLLSQAPSLEK
jgi:hypothetical protein